MANAVLNEIQRGTVTLLDTTSTITVVKDTDAGFDTTVTQTKTILKFSYQGSGSGAFVDMFLAASLSADGNTIIFSRTGTSGAITINWWLESWTSGVIVQHFELVCGDASATQAITGASAGGRFIVPLGAVVDAGAASLTNSLGQLKFDSDTQVSVTRGSATGSVTYHFQVVEYKGCTVQEDTFEFTATTNTTDTRDITTPVTIANTLLIATCTVDGGGADDVLVSLNFADTDTINFVRNTGGSVTFNITLFTIEFTDGTLLRQNAVAHGSGTGTVNTTITAVVIAQSVPMMTACTNWFGAMGRTALTGTAYDRHFVTNALSATTNHRSIRGDSLVAQDYDSQVIQFALGAAAAEKEPFISARWLRMPSLRKAS